MSWSRDPEPPLGIAELHPGSDRVGGRPRRSDAPTHWLEAGPLTGWTVAMPRTSRRTPVVEPDFRFALTEVATPRHPEAIRRWVDHQRLLVTLPSETDETDETGSVFWRLAINRRGLTTEHRTLALGALPCPNVEIALGRIRRAVHRAARLHVALAFFPDRAEPRWLVHDNDTPVLAGFPHQHLVATSDPRTSLAGMLLTATTERYIHRAGDDPTPEPPTV